jgi:osomolarity two-component system sensor histidine kinase NIK1
MTEDRARCLNAGMDDHLTKPVRIDDLRNALQRWVYQNDAARRDDQSSVA